MGITTFLRWDGHDLYAGGIYVGCVMLVVPPNWREMSIYKDEYAGGVDYVGRNITSAKIHHARHETKPWRGWLMTSEDGEEAGYWATIAEATRKMEAMAVRGLQS
jgi:hypothetical protein